MDDSSAVEAAVSDPAFWSRVDRSGDCWEWRGYRDRQGYGMVTRTAISPSPLLVHRYVWMRLHGPIEAGVVIRHRCDNPPCVNPAHLLHGSQADNIKDRQVRGRHRPGRLLGEKHPAHKLTLTQVIEIRALWRWGVPVRSLAGEYGVHPATIDAVVHGRTWKEAA